VYIIDSCPCCGSRQLKKWPAIVAPFIAHYACGIDPQPCNLCECRSCTFRFFDSRLTDSEIARLYAGYRGSKYFEARHRDEYWYSASVNAAIGNDADEIVARKQNLSRLLEERSSSIRSVLDYGGDRGQFIPDNLGEERYVFEISDAEPVDGVCRIESVDGRQFDFVMLAHVLEHCSEPSIIAGELKKLANTKTIFYFEVPYERPSLLLAQHGRLQRAYLDALLRSSSLLAIVDLYSTVCRVKLNCIPPLGLQKCSEHLNFFNEKSLRALLERSGYELLDCGTAQTSSPGPIGRILFGVARVA